MSHTSICQSTFAFELFTLDYTTAGAPVLCKQKMHEKKNDSGYGEGGLKNFQKLIRGEEGTAIHGMTEQEDQLLCINRGGANALQIEGSASCVFLGGHSFKKHFSGKTLI